MEAQIQTFDYTTDRGEGHRARIGLLVLETDQTIEPELRDLLDLPGIATYHSRLANDPIVTPESLAQMQAELPRAACLIPAGIGLTALAYGCTSGATIIGAPRVAEILRAHHPAARVTDPLTAAQAAFRALDVGRIALLTPYSVPVTSALRDTLQGAGLTVPRIGTFDQHDDGVVGKITPDAIAAAVDELGQDPRVEAVFVSCTSLRAAARIPAMERALGKPVTSSNHALAWHLLRLAGIPDSLPAKGRLFAAPLKERP